MNLKNSLNNDQTNSDLLDTNSRSNNVKSYQTPVLTEYGDVTSIIEAGGNGSLDIFLGPTFI